MTTRVIKDMVTMRNAVEWIALNDNPGENDSPDILQGYISVMLVADLFGVRTVDVATKVAAFRKREI